MYNREIFSLTHGDASLTWPKQLDDDEIEFIETWLLHTIAKIKRRQAAKAAAQPTEAARDE